MKLATVLSHARHLSKVHGPTIAFAGGIVLFAGAIALTVKATKKYGEEIENEKIKKFTDEHCYDDPQPKTVDLSEVNLDKKIQAKVIAKTYWPVALTAASSLGLFIFARHMNLQKTAALALACSATDKSFKDYKEKVKELLGKKSSDQVEEAVERDRLVSVASGGAPKDSQIINTGHGQVLCFDSLSGRFFRSNADHIAKAENEINRRLNYERTVVLNEFYYELDIPGVKLGEDSGWDADCDCLLRLKYSWHGEPYDEPCLYLSYDVMPILGRYT